MDEMESTPQISETQSQSVDGTEDVTQEYMVPEQLERERLRTEIKRMKHAKLLDDHNKKKHINSLPFETIDDYEEEFSTKLSLQKFINVCKNLTPNQISLVKDIGFGNLLDLCCTELPRTLVRWLVRYFQSSTNTFNLPGGFSFILNSFTVHRILGIPIGGRNIPKKCSQSLRQQLKIETKCAGQTPSIKEMIDLLTPPQDEGTPELLGDQFKRIFVMFATAVFLCPTTYECVSPDYLAALEGPTTDISTYDWSGATLEKLVSSIKTYKQKEFTGALCGCLIIPVITYFEYLNIEVENNLLTRSNMPARLQIWNTDIVKKYAQLDRLSMEGNFGRHSLKDIRCTPFHPSSTSEPKVFHMSSRMEAYLECFVPENKLSDAKQQVASIVKHMYTNIFSVIQPVIEDNVEKLISIGRDLAGNKVKRSDQGLNCNLTEQVCNTKENISTNPSSSIDSRKGCSASQHSQSQSQAEISCSQKQSFAVPHSGITNFLNTLSSGENSDSHPTIKTNNSADCQKSTCATVDVIKQDGETRCDKQPEKAQEDNTIHEKDVDAADNTCVNSPSDTKKDVAAQHGKGCSASQHSQSQNNASQHSQSQSQDHTEISCSLPKKSSSELKHIKEVYEMDLIEAISDECKAQCQHMINYINTCLDCLPIHSPFEPILDMIESGAYIKTCENSDSDEATLLHKNCVDCQSKICATEHRIQGKGDVATCETTTAKCVNQTQKAHANSTPLADKSTLPVQCSASVKVDGTCTPLVAAAYNQQQTCVTSQAENLLEVKGDVSASEKSTTKCANQPEKDEAGKTPLPAQPVPTVAHPKNISKADVSMNKVKKRSLLDYFDIIKRDKRVKISDPSIEGASKQAEAQMISDAGNYIHLSDDTFLYDADNTFFYDDEFWIKAFKVVEQSQKCASDEPNPENNLNFPQHQLEAQSYSQKPEGPIPQGNNSSHSTEEASALQ